MNERIVKIRKMNELTQDEFALKMKISKNYVSLIENGKKTPSDRLIADICRRFCVNENWLRTGDGDMISDKNTTDFGYICSEIGTTDAKARDAIIKYYELSESDKELFWQFINRFIKKSGD